jgi:hypothetical protein
MGDKLRSSIGVIPSFVDGEQPPAAKLNSLGTQSNRGFQNLEKASGDIHDESWPYSDASGTHLTDAWGKRILDGEAAAGAEERRLDIANLARLVGPASALNPEMLSLNTTVQGEVIPDSVYEFTLRYKPTGASFNFSDAVVFASKKASPELMQADGDYYIDDAGKVYTVLPTDVGSTVNYIVNPKKFLGGPNYPDANFNVIPDPNQISNSSAQKILVTGPDADGLYTITLPTITHQQIDYDLSDSLLATGEDFNAGRQLTLPHCLTDNLVAGETIPEGFLYLRDDDTGEVYTDAVYIYESSSSFSVQNVDLGDYSGTTFSVFTVGTNITYSVDDLRRKFFHHSHSRRFGEAPVSAFDLADLYRNPGSSGQFCPSENPNNPFAQYLHRDGWVSGVDESICDQNAMRGWLAFVLQGKDPGQGFSSPSPQYDQTYGIVFGNPDNPMVSARIWKNGAIWTFQNQSFPSSRTRFTNGPVYLDDGLYAGTDYAGNAFKFYTGTFTLSGGVWAFDTWQVVSLPDIDGHQPIAVMAWACVGLFRITPDTGGAYPFSLVIGTNAGLSEVYVNLHTYRLDLSAATGPGFVNSAWNPANDYTFQYVVIYTDF